MEKKIVVFLEIIFILVVCGFYIVKEVIPEYKKEFGSSDNFINANKYKNMFEFNIDNKINFALIIDESDNIYHIMFFDKNAICLYNQDIENSSMASGVLKVVKSLIENSYLFQTSVIKVTRYDDYHYSDFKDVLLKVLEKYNISTAIIEEENTLIHKSSYLKLDASNDAVSILRNMDLYSKEFTRSTTIANQDDSVVVLDRTSSRTFANNVYKKIEDYVLSNNITTLERDNTDLVIHLLPAEASGVYFPSTNSWYYVDGGKVYAYIEFVNDTNSYGYCYHGSIDLYQEGEC